MKHHNDLPGLSPMQEYTPPQLPTFREADPAQLKTLPSRWAKNTAVVACIGILGTATLSGCFGERLHNGGGPIAPYYVTCPTEQETTQYTGSYTEFDLTVRIHTGGGGAGPFYVVHLTEAEALSILRAQLESAGLRFGAALPNASVELWGEEISFRPGLFDSERNVALMLLSWEQNNRQFFSHGGPELARRTAEEFAQMGNDFITGVFFNPGETTGLGEDSWMTWSDLEVGPPSAERKAEARANLVANLNEQAQAFIALLQEEEVL